jgi:hypothetical protein
VLVCSIEDFLFEVEFWRWHMVDTL